MTAMIKLHQENNSILVNVEHICVIRPDQIMGTAIEMDCGHTTVVSEGVLTVWERLEELGVTIR